MIICRLLIICTATMLAGCQTFDQSPHLPLPITARGQEPGWIMHLNEQKLELEYQYGEKQFAVATPQPQVIDNGVRYRLQGDQKLVVDVARVYCEDVMSGMPHPYAVSIELDDEVLHGCGGDPQALLVGPEWIVDEIDGGPVAKRYGVTVHFENNRVYGSSGCNRFTGGYQITGEGIDIGQLALTRMACEPHLMIVENQMTTVLGRINRFRIDASGNLRLTGSEGASLKAHKRLQVGQ